MEETNKVLLFLKTLEQPEYFILFESENEILPYDTIKNSQAYKNNFIENFEIKEYMMNRKDSDDNLIESSSYLAGFKVFN